jgi:hypothetical protein
MQSAARWRGTILDLAVAAANLFLLASLARVLRAGGQGFLAPEKNNDTIAGQVSPRVGWLFLSVFVAHTLGAFFKRLPRDARLAGFAPPEAEPNRFVVVAACVLLLFHFTIFLLLLMSGWESTALNKWSPLFGNEHGGNSWFNAIVRFVLFIFILPLPTVLTLISLGTGGGDAPSTAAPPAMWRTHWLTELSADLLLYYSIIVITVIMRVVVEPRFVDLEGTPGSTSGGSLISIVPMLLAFLILYLPPRLIYLAEDYQSPRAWFTILLALTTLAYRTYFPDRLVFW